MMNALDSTTLPPVPSVHSIPAGTAEAPAAKLGRPPNRKKNTRPREKKCVIDPNGLPTDVSVTPVPSEDRSPCPGVPVMVVSKQRSEGARMLVRNGLSVRGALVELQQLRGRLLHAPAPSADAAAPVGKENYHPSVTGGRPFEALIDSLRRMNPELGAGQGQSIPGTSASPAQFRILRLPSPRPQDFPVKFPSVAPAAPRHAWESVDRIHPAEEFFWQMPAVSEPTRQTNEQRERPSLTDDLPLLHLSENHFPPCVRDAPFLNGLPFPMLQLMDPRGGQVPFFVPPEEIVGRNNNNREMLVAARSGGMQAVRSEPQSTGVSSQRRVELLHLQPRASQANDVVETDSRQVLNRPFHVL